MHLYSGRFRVILTSKISAENFSHAKFKWQLACKTRFWDQGANIFKMKNILVRLFVKYKKEQRTKNEI